MMATSPKAMTPRAITISARLKPFVDLVRIFITCVARAQYAEKLRCFRSVRLLVDLSFPLVSTYPSKMPN